LQPANFLILDEPTNHLDIQSQEVLQQALANYRGTYAIVSHNRAFLDPLVTKVLEFTPQKAPRLYHGNLSDYLEKKEAERELKSRGSSPSSGGESSGQAAGRKEQRRREARQRQELSVRLKPLRVRLEEIESLIASLEQEKPQLLGKLGDPEFFKREPDQARITAQRYQDLEGDMQKAYSEWDQVSDEIERIEAESSL